MKKITKILSVLMAFALVSAASPLAAARKRVDDEKKIKIHINAELRDDLGMTVDNIERASRWFFNNHGVEVVDESGEDVVELHVVVGQDDADDDNDGTPDSKDADEDGDKIEDSQETDFAVDLDKAEPEVMETFEHQDKQRGVYILFYTAGKTSEHIRGFSEVDSFEAEKESSNLGNRSALFQKVGFSVPPQQGKSTVNQQITDSVTQANVKVLGDAPAMAMGNLFQATATALSRAARNATGAQQQTNVTAQAATTMGVATLYSIDTASVGVMSLMGALGKR